MHAPEAPGPLVSVAGSAAGRVIRRVDRYELLEQVGSGGMAVVYRGRDSALDREVAVKVLHPHLAGRPESRARFAREARAVARLRHPAIVEIYDYAGDAALESYLVTEFVRGRTLRAFAEEESFALPEVGALVVRALADALAHAHAAGVIHRDLKPENVLVLESEGRRAVKLVDFGIARLVSSDERMTMTGALVGSPNHMAPEIIAGEEADARSDVFSLGTILYWLATGAMPFAAANPTATLRRVIEGEVTEARTLAPQLSDELSAVLVAAMATEPAQRTPSAVALRDGLDQALAAAGLDDPPAELQQFLRAPRAYQAGLRGRLADTALSRADEALAAGHTPRALRLLDRVLALRPGDAGVALRLDRVAQAARRRRLIRRAAVAVALVVALALGAALAVLRPWRSADEVGVTGARATPGEAPPSPAAVGVTGRQTTSSEPPPSPTVRGVTGGQTASGEAPPSPAAGGVTGSQTTSGGAPPSPADDGATGARANPGEALPSPAAGGVAGGQTASGEAPPSPAEDGATGARAVSGGARASPAEGRATGGQAIAGEALRSPAGPDATGRQPVPGKALPSPPEGERAGRGGGPSRVTPGSQKSAPPRSAAARPALAVAERAPAAPDLPTAAAARAASAPGKPAVLAVHVTPYAQRALLDGVEVARGEGRVTFSLTPGEPHRIQIEHVCCFPFVKEVAAGEVVPAELKERLRPRPARLRVEGDPRARVFVEGRPVGTAGESQHVPLEVPVPASGGSPYDAPADLRLELAGTPPVRATIRLRAGADVTFAAPRADRAPGPAAQPGEAGAP